MTDRAPRPEGMSDAALTKRIIADIRALVRNRGGSVVEQTWAVPVASLVVHAERLLSDADRLRADGATLLHRAEQAETTAGDAKREIDRLVVRCGEFSEAHAASFKALHTLSAALFDGEVDDYTALAEKIIARVKQAEADGATLRERVLTRDQVRVLGEKYLTDEVIVKAIKRYEDAFHDRDQFDGPSQRMQTAAVSQARRIILDELFGPLPASAPKAAK